MKKVLLIAVLAVFLSCNSTVNKSESQEADFIDTTFIESVEKKADEVKKKADELNKDLDELIEEL